MAYPISTPVEFTIGSTPGAEIDFNSDAIDNRILNFVVTTAGDLVYREAGGSNHLTRLAIGSAGEILTVAGGVPTWAANGGGVAGDSAFTATVTGSLGAIPTSRDGGGDSGMWFPLSGVVALPAPYVTWSTAAPATDADGVFVTAAGASYGRFVVPAGGTGVYRLSAQVTFDSGAGVGAGSGLPAAPLPSGRAIRQARIFRAVGTVEALSVVSVGNNPNNDNQTVAWMVAECVALTAADEIEIQVRHDRSAANTVTIGDAAIAVDFQTYFSGVRLR